MKKKKTGDEKRMMKLRAALRLVWSRDYSHKEAVDKACYKVHIDSSHKNEIVFDCPMCKTSWPKFAARVDHYPPLGEFHTLEEASVWMMRLFTGFTRVLCKPCHDKVTAIQRRKGAKNVST